MRFDTQYLLQNFRGLQRELFDENNKPYRMLQHVGPMCDMLELINALEQEITSFAIIVWKNKTFKAVESKSTFEYECDPDWFMTININTALSGMDASPFT